MVVDAPAQIVDEEALILNVGETLTVITLDAVAEHPLAFVPVHEYVVIAEGLTVIEDEVTPLLHR